LDTYLFFSPDKAKAQYHFKAIVRSGITNRQFKNKNTYKKFIDNLDNITNVSSPDLSLYNSYLFHAIRLRAYHQILPILFSLKERNLDDPKITSLLGKTLFNRVIGREDEGIPYIIESIELYKRDANYHQSVNLIMFYLYGLLNRERINELESAIQTYQSDLANKAIYHRFIARYYVYLKKPEKEIINQYQLALETAKDREEHKASIKAYIYFLENERKESCPELVASLKQNLDNEVS
jgi:hypothetical protein